MVHVPIPVNTAEVWSIVQTAEVRVANVTFNPEVELASSAIEPSEKVASDGVVNEIVWPPLATVKVLVTGVALLLLVLLLFLFLLFYKY